ncbi:N-acetylglucosaminylphosphatidylinositol deacetylase [Mycobacterium parascrofulaceum ATCC BAA-614]|uniref:N-acetylglucosaminylphosphatidylinositol deacetylase n=1 Tax=Mycobacterium parascrofulaceum ATCC BAA-614 TaxID=525368 RepID=D5PDK2_9MYCO|nr:MULTISPECIES: PIG-L deacetylase family protein [Mycobacterium]EFG75831.1 N-acetylglucosaminylphosphatidylinositol deacetylase [Mycobacterium parascrofulaceum ATCC BAA-614]OCB28134.1 LmbE family protein [Mycobacterium malmoense]
MRTAPTSNSARFAAKPLTYGGTPAPLWLAAFERSPLPALDLAQCRRLIVVAPHPDDETLGLGATIAQLIASGVEVRVVSVSDGGAAQPGATLSGRLRLSTTRRYELRRATGVLGAAPPVRLGMPDGELGDHEDRLTGALTEILRTAGPGTWCAATWRGDGHPDHEAVGRAAAAACQRTGVALLEYPVWMWHWASPADAAVPWERAHSVPAPGWAVNRKRQAAQCYRSQLRPGRGETPPVLPPFVVQRLLAVGEVVFR